MNHVVTSFLSSSGLKTQNNNDLKWKMCVKFFIYLIRNTLRLWDGVGCVVCAPRGLVLFYHNSCTCETVQFCSVAMAISSELSLSDCSLKALFVWWAGEIPGFWERARSRFFMLFLRLRKCSFLSLSCIDLASCSAVSLSHNFNELLLWLICLTWWYTEDLFLHLLVNWLKIFLMLLFISSTFLL